MHFNVIMLDTTANKYYDSTTLEREPLGGTEATIIRVAESLAQVGLSVAVVQTTCPPFEPVMGQYAFFMHNTTLPADTTCDYFIQIRGISNSHLFPEAQKFVWMHDLGHEKMKDWPEKLNKHNVKMIAVSRWHKKNLKKYLDGYDNITYIYNPVPDSLYIPPEKRSSYDRNLIAWLSSPHKGLGQATRLFKKIHEMRPQIKFLIFNPGYLQIDTVALSSNKGMYYSGPENCKTVWSVLQRCLCVFYPTDWEETFGCIASEANALGVPLATFKKGALNEVVTSDNQLLEEGDEEGIINRVIEWHDNGRPMIHGNEEFKLSVVVDDWLSLLQRSKNRIITK